MFAFTFCLFFLCMLLLLFWRIKMNNRPPCAGNFCKLGTVRERLRLSWTFERDCQSTKSKQSNVFHRTTSGDAYTNVGSHVKSIDSVCQLD